MLILGFGIWFWALVLVEISLLTWFVEEEWGLASVLSLLIFVVLLWWLADVPVWAWLKENPLTLLKYAGYYIAIGVLWTFCKYYFALKKLRGKVKKAKEAWQQMQLDKESRQHPAFEDVLRNHLGYNDKSKFENTIEKLVIWASFWPTSMIWTILNDPVRRLFKYIIHDIFIGFYRKMYDQMVGNMLKEVENEKVGSTDD